jgi:toxin secretion/phage lysis holin
MKEGICTGIGLIGSFIASLFGGWDAALMTLILFMVIDYVSGLLVAGVFHNSTKTDTGTLESKAGWKGLCRKGMTLLFVLIGYRLDLALDIDYVRNAVVIGFMANELISIVENAGLMGLPLPAVITKAVDILTKKAAENQKDGEE